MTLEDLKDEHFNHYESGKIIAGFRWIIRTDLGDETHECYQYNDLADVKRTAEAFMGIKGMLQFQIVTHKGGYKGMKVLHAWSAAQ